MKHASATLVPLLSGGALAGLAFLAILVFGLIAVRSLTGHIRRSRTPWPGEVDGGVPLGDGEPDAEAAGGQVPGSASDVTADRGTPSI